MNKQNSELKQGEVYGCRYCLECGSDAVAPNNTCKSMSDELWMTWGDMGRDDWPAGEQNGECECGHIGPVGRDIIKANHPFYSVIGKATIIV